MNKISAAFWHASKVGGHIILAILITGTIAYFKHDPKLIVYMPVVNIVTAGLIKYFSLENEVSRTEEGTPQS
jgi:preprotein translocase subunit Sec61beta